MRFLARPFLIQLVRSKSTTAYTCRYDFDTLSVTSPSESVLHVELNRPEKQNQFNKTMFRELHECFSQIEDDQDARVVVLSGKGKEFSAGMDWEDMVYYMKRISKRKVDCGNPSETSDVARTAKLIRSTLIQFQESFTVIEKCSKPVIAAVHGACSGAALALLTVTDIRYCAKNAHFQAKEVDNGMTADLGTLQRLPKIIGNDSFAREMIYTAKQICGETAKQAGLVSRVFENEEDCVLAAIETGKLIASKSPVAVQGSKVLLKYSRDHSVRDGLLCVANWNMAMLQSEDIGRALQAQQENKEPKFDNL